VASERPARPTMHTAFESTRGQRACLDDFRGRPTVIFYEHRGTERDNEALKYALRDRARDAGWSIHLVGFACLKGYPSYVRPIIRPAVRAIAEAFGWELWLDFEGALLDGPFAFDPRRANVAVLDAEGRVRFQAAGALDGGQRDEVVALVTSLMDPESLASPAAA
jgi:hypothetical protein